MLHGSLRGPFSRSRGAPGPAPTQSETTSWQAQVVTNGGAVSAARFIIVNNFIAAEKAAGTWALTDDYWGLWAEDTIGALTSLKQRRMGGTFGAPSFVPSRGYTFDGATNYMNTLFVPSTMAVAMTATSLRGAAYERTSIVTATASMGTAGALVTNPCLTIFAGTGSAMFTKVNANANTQFTLLVATSLGYTAGSLNGTAVTDLAAYKNGIAQVRVGAPTIQSGLPVQAIYIGAFNNNGSAAGFRAASIGFACAGASLSPTQEQAQYTNVQAWATAIGAQV